MRMESHLIWNRKPTENMHDYAMLLCIFKAILRGWSLNCLLFPCSEPENNEPWLIDPQHSTAKKWDGPQQVSIPISFPISTMHQVLYDPTCVVRECFFPLCSRNLPNIQIRSNQSIRPEQFSINWDRPKLPLHIQKYPGISRNKEYANPHVSKNMQKHVSDNASPKPRTELWKSPSTQHHASATNLLATPQSHARNHPKIPCISYHTLAQHSTGASSFLIMTKAEFWAQLPWGGNGY